jgi:hypothetical protein
MKINKKEDPKIVSFHKKIKAVLSEADIMSLFSTLLGAADNVAKYIIEKEKGNFVCLPYQCKYGLLHIHQILRLFGSIFNGEITNRQFEIGGFFPAGGEAWKGEGDFEKRFVLMVRLFYKHLTEQGKIKPDSPIQD